MAAQPDAFLVGDVYRAAKTCRRILHHDLMDLARRDFVELEAKVTLLLIHLNDLLQKAAKSQRRVAFADAIEGDNQGKDVTDIINSARNAACHISSPNNRLQGGSVFAFNAIRGYAPNAYEINGVMFGCNYADDMAIYYGTTFVLIKRHLQRAFDEVVEKFAPELGVYGGLE